MDRTIHVRSHFVQVLLPCIHLAGVTDGRKSRAHCGLRFVLGSSGIGVFSGRADLTEDLVI